MDHPIIQRSEAKEIGAVHYFTGKPCRRGGVALRMTRNGQCLCDGCVKRQSDSTKKWIANNRPRMRERGRAHYERNSDLIKAKNLAYQKTESARSKIRLRHELRCKDLEYRANFLAKLKAYAKSPRGRVAAKEYQSRSRERIRQNSRRWYRNNQEKVAQQVKANRHKPGRREARASYYRRRYKDDPKFRMHVFMRGQINRILKKSGGSKTSRSEKMLGYTREMLVAHIESQFHSGMNWGNHGVVWQIDHIAPVAELLRCGVRCQTKINALCNLRPLLTKDNILKSDGFQLGVSVHG